MTGIETDVASARQVALLAALLDHAVPPWAPGVLPPLAHWLLFPPLARQSVLGPDGHPARAETHGLPRRMWAGSRVRFIAPVPIGAAVTRRTVEQSAVEKMGRSGRMRFVTLLHEIAVDGRVAIAEEQDLVYREPPAPDASARPPAPAEAAPVPAVSRTLRADLPMLFRYSALTYNAHRIHYDRDYAVDAERYPALVVHGPLLATLLIDLYLRHRPQAPIAAFAFRAQRPVFDIDPFTLGLTETADGAALVVIDAAGGIAMDARVTAG